MNTITTQNTDDGKIEWSIEEIKNAWINAAETGYDPKISEATKEDWHDFWYNSIEE